MDLWSSIKTIYLTKILKKDKQFLSTSRHYREMDLSSGRVSQAEDHSGAAIISLLVLKEDILSLGRHIILL